MRKTFQIVLLGMACFLSIGCNKDPDALNLGSKSTYEMKDDVVSMTIKEETLTGKSAIIVLKNNMKDTYLYGDFYSIEYQKNGRWYTIVPREEMNFVMIAYLLNPSAMVEIEINWEDFYGTLPKGKYRIVKSVSPDSRKEEKIYISVEFTIE